MKDSDLIDFIEILREIPRERWEFLCFIREMDEGYIKRIKNMVENGCPEPAPPSFEEPQIQAPPESSIEDFRKFL